MSVAAVAVGTAVVGAGVGMYSANKAAKAQRAAADKASATELEMFYAAQDAQKPWMDVGEQGLNELAYRLGLSGTGALGSVSANSLATKPLVDMSSGTPQADMDLYNTSEQYRNAWNSVAAMHDAKFGLPYDSSSDPRWIENFMRERIGTDAAAETSRRANDPNFGSLLKNFSADDLKNDVVYNSGLEFGLNEGTKGVNRMFAAQGARDSGQVLKALTRFANDYGSTKANEAFNRFNANQDKTFNRLASLANVGQASAQQTGSQAISTGQSIGNNIVGAGNARAASYIGASNALTGGIGQGVNMWQQQQMMNSLRPAPQQTYMTPSGGIDYTKNGWWDVNSFGAA